MPLLSQDQRFLLANRLCDVLQTLLVKESQTPVTTQTVFQGNIPSDDAKVEEFDRRLEESALNFLNIEGDDNG